jgi:peptidoglycan hydrolase-like protein with peptidoglycan-binding domain
MTLSKHSMLGAGLIAAACLLPLTAAAAQTGPASTTERDGPAHIMRFQQDLNANGFSVPVNGVLGSETVAALRKYQRDHGLPVTGRTDVETFTSLEGVAPPTQERANITIQAPPGMAPPAVQIVPGAPPPG